MIPLFTLSLPPLTFNLPPVYPRSTLILIPLYPHFQFDPKEKECIMSLAMGEDALETAKAGGWGSYLPRWGGL